MLRQTNVKPIIVTLFLCTYCVFLYADSGDIITAKPVSVKQNGENSFEAKQKATDRAARLAFFQVLKENYNLSRETIGKLSSEQIKQCISGCSIEQEKQSESFYIARLAYRFTREMVESLLESKGLGQRLRQTEAATVYPVSAQNSCYLELPTSTFIAYRESLEKIGYSVLEFSSKRTVIMIKSVDALKTINLGPAAVITFE
ncbi:MAG: hypothetical protein LBD81_02610 [Holosporaceae bacterium]|jgi:hypothetical protein|nr:hypothetical protein [Holosporaceae bacterium]